MAPPQQVKYVEKNQSWLPKNLTYKVRTGEQSEQSRRNASFLLLSIPSISLLAFAHDLAFGVFQKEGRWK